MDFVKVRHDFTVYVVDSETSYCDLVSECLKGAGYHVETFMKGEDVVEQIKAHPPHIIILGTYLMGMTGLQLVRQVREMSADIQLVFMANYAEGEIASEALALGAVDRVFKPIQNVADVVSAVDRVAERKFLEFSNEALYNKLVSSKTAQRQLRRRFISERTILDLAQRLGSSLKNAQDGSHAIDTFVEIFEKALSTSILFFRHLPIQNNFICTHSSHENLKGVQLNLSLEALEAEGEGARDVLTVLLNQNQFDYRRITVATDVIGLLVIGKSLADPVQRRSVDHAIQVFEARYELLETKKILYENLIRDTATGAWTKSEFQRRAIEEISRSRRIKMPVSMLYIGIDGAPDLKTALGTHEFDNLMKAFAGLLIKTSRATDIVGRYNEAELGVLLPHTDKLGAAIKAEKFRRLVERSDLNIRVSIGVSEYPSICMDAETLWNAADSAYFQVKRLGNKVCLAAAPKGFEPDYITPEKA